MPLMMTERPQSTTERRRTSQTAPITVESAWDAESALVMPRWSVADPSLERFAMGSGHMTWEGGKTSAPTRRPQGVRPVMHMAWCDDTMGALSR